MNKKKETLEDLFKKVVHPENLSTSGNFLFGIRDTIKAFHKGRLARLIRKSGQEPQEINTLEDAFKYGKKITTDGFDEASKDAGYIQKVLRPFGKAGENLQANMAKRRQEGVCKDAATVYDQTVREKRKDLKGCVVDGMMTDKGVEGSGAHAANIKGNKNTGYFFVDTTRGIEKKIEGANTLKEAKKVLLEGIGDVDKDGFNFKSRKKLKQWKKLR